MKLNAIDKAILRIDEILGRSSKTPSPAVRIQNTEPLTEPERQQSIQMMRVNHSGEVCAQALYHGQALTANSSDQYNALLQAAAEETDHLAWCKQRLNELDGRSSLLNPIWYLGSLGIGALAGLAGDKLSLGFLSETEHQVTKHIEQHLSKMSVKDQKSRAVLEQMRIDELQHATNAEQAGATNLPAPIKIMMRLTAKILTVTAAKI